MSLGQVALARHFHAHLLLGPTAERIDKGYARSVEPFLEQTLRWGRYQIPAEPGGDVTDLNWSATAPTDSLRRAFRRISFELLPFDEVHHQFSKMYPLVGTITPTAAQSTGHRDAVGF